MVFSLIILLLSCIPNTMRTSELCLLEKSQLATESEREKTVRECASRFATFKALCLYQAELKDSDFVHFTDLCTPFKDKFKALQLLDLSHNALTSAATDPLIFWLELPKLTHICIVGNMAISLKHIDSVQARLVQLGRTKPDVARFMQKFIFMTANYIKQANETVQTYKDLVAKNCIPANWAQLHRAFYKSPLCKALAKQKKQLSQTVFSRPMPAPVPVPVTSKEQKSSEGTASDDSAKKRKMAFGLAVSKLYESSQSDAGSSASGDKSDESSSSEEAPIRTTRTLRDSPRSDESDYEERVDAASYAEHILDQM